MVDSDSVRIGGDKFDESIVRYVKKEYNILIGDTTGETIKKTIGNVYPGAEIKTMEVRGRDGINGLPATVKVTSEDVRKALEEPLETLLGKIRYGDPCICGRQSAGLCGFRYRKGVGQSGQVAPRYSIQQRHVLN